MQIAYHLGAPFTDEDALIWSLRRDRQALAQAGIAIPRPRFYRSQMSRLTTTLRGNSLSTDAQMQFLSDISFGADTSRVVMSDNRFICAHAKIFFGGEFYGKAGFKTAWLRQAFPDHACEFFLSIRNPATFLSELLRAEAPTRLPDLLQGANTAQMRWSVVIARIRAANPDTQITVWCNEDTPLIWPLVLSAVAGIEPDVPIDGSADITRTLLTPEGQESLTSALGDPISADMDKTMHALGAHLHHYLDQSTVEEEIDVPGWQDEHVELMTAAYEADIDRIGAIEGVNFLRA